MAMKKDTKCGEEKGKGKSKGKERKPVQGNGGESRSCKRKVAKCEASEKFARKLHLTL